MGYVKCPKCSGNNRDTDSKCYLCGSELVPASGHELGDEGSEQAEFDDVNDLSQVSCIATLGSFSLPLASSIGLGFGLGALQEKAAVSLPQWSEGIVLALVCSLVSAFVAWAMANTEIWRLVAKAGQVVASGVLIGICWSVSFWGFGFDLPKPYLGALIGLCSGLPIALFLRPQNPASKILGKSELKNLAICLGLGLLPAGIALSIGSGAQVAIGWLGASLGLAACCGGRITIDDMASTASSVIDASDTLGITAALERESNYRSGHYHSRFSPPSGRSTLWNIIDFFR